MFGKITAFGSLLCLLVSVGAAQAKPAATQPAQPACCATKTRCCKTAKYCCDQPDKATCCKTHTSCCKMKECCGTTKKAAAPAKP